ncbi:MAG: hypothetical protein QOE35_3539 [Actinomycetota bacterium]
MTNWIGLNDGRRPPTGHAGEAESIYFADKLSGAFVTDDNAAHDFAQRRLGIGQALETVSVLDEAVAMGELSVAEAIGVTESIRAAGRFLRGLHPGAIYCRRLPVTPSTLSSVMTTHHCVVYTCIESRRQEVTCGLFRFAQLLLVGEAVPAMVRHRWQVDVYERRWLIHLPVGHSVRAAYGATRRNVGSIAPALSTSVGGGSEQEARELSPFALTEVCGERQTFGELGDVSEGRIRDGLDHCGAARSFAP